MMASEEPQSRQTSAFRALLQHPASKAALPFINGGLAGMTATAAIQPIDMVKVRLQLAGEGVKTGPKPSPLAVTRQIIVNGKILDLYTGLSAGLLRQAVYTTARIGLFDTFTTQLKARHLHDSPVKDVSSSPKSSSSTPVPSPQQQPQLRFSERAGAGLAAGGIAAMIGNPCDLALIRMQSDGLKPAAQRQNYRSVVDALVRIQRTEGVRALWAGSAPTVARAMALNFGQLAFFSEAKTRLRDSSNGLSPHMQTLAASAVAGFFASFFSLPFDFVKTRLQKQQKTAGAGAGGVQYRGMLDCFRKVAQQEGLLRFYRGFGTYYVRIAPHAMVTLIVADALGFVIK